MEAVDVCACTHALLNQAWSSTKMVITFLTQQVNLSFYNAQKLDLITKE
jgi:hypothetical protein